MAGLTNLFILDTIIQSVEFINQYVILPLITLSFIMILYFIVFLRRNDQDVIKSKIFLKSDEFVKAFTVLAVIALALVFHVFLIYLHHFIVIETPKTLLFISRIQQLLGLVVTLLLVVFAGKIYKIVR